MRILQTGSAVLLGLALAGSACAKKPAASPAAPRYPDYVFPAVPADLSATLAARRHERGWQLLQAGSLRPAQREFEGILKAAPDFFPSEVGLGYVRVAQRDFKAAIGLFDRALQQAMSYVPALLGRAEALLESGQEDEALASFDLALELDPGAAEIRRRVEVLRFRRLQERVERGRRAAAEGRLDEATQAYEQAIAASPDSAFLYKDLAAVERRQGRAAAALERVRRAVELDPNDSGSFVLLGELLEERGAFDEAARAYGDADALEPSPTLGKKRSRALARGELARLPAEYRAIPDLAQLARADLAALLGVRLTPLLARARGAGEAVVITDTRHHWAAAWILQVTGAGVMEVYPNHTFGPSAPVRRGDLAAVVSRVLDLIAAGRPALAQPWRQSRRKLTDVPPGHALYAAASGAVAAGVLPLLEGDTFQPSRPVSGAEAVVAVERLEALARGSG